MRDKEARSEAKYQKEVVNERFLRTEKQIRHLFTRIQYLEAALTQLGMEFVDAEPARWIRCSKK